MEILYDRRIIKKVHPLFWRYPPFPPKHIMKSLVRMKDDGTFDAKLKAVSSIRGKLKDKIEETSEEKMSIIHPFFKDKLD